MHSKLRDGTPLEDRGAGRGGRRGVGGVYMLRDPALEIESSIIITH
jgi:hypothetical protein